jgi:hypothetical protein
MRPLLLLPILAFLLLTGCETLRFGVATDYGTFGYELPRTTSTK